MRYNPVLVWCRVWTVYQTCHLSIHLNTIYVFASVLVLLMYIPGKKLDTLLTLRSLSPYFCNIFSRCYNLTEASFSFVPSLLPCPYIDWISSSTYLTSFEVCSSALVGWFSHHHYFFLVLSFMHMQVRYDSSPNSKSFMYTKNGSGPKTWALLHATFNPNLLQSFTSYLYSLLPSPKVVYPVKEFAPYTCLWFQLLLSFSDGI